MDAHTVWAIVGITVACVFLGSAVVVALLVWLAPYWRPDGDEREEETHL